MSTPMKVFPELFVGVRASKLGFMAPHTKDKACDKRKQTIMYWLKNTYGHKEAAGQTFIHENAALSGFKITDSIKRSYWGGGNVVFRVEDPRGFELEISDQNLMMLIRHAEVKEGVIQGRCIWGRLGAQNILLHETSEEYASAQKNPEVLKQKRKPILKSQLVVGQTYKDAYDRPMVYLGEKMVRQTAVLRIFNYNPYSEPTSKDGPSELAKYMTWGVCRFGAYVIITSKNSIAYSTVDDVADVSVFAENARLEVYHTTLPLSATQNEWYNEQRRWHRDSRIELRYTLHPEDNQEDV